MSLSPDELASRLRDLMVRVDAFFERVQGEWPDRMACRSGCTACCHVRLTVTALEAALIDGHVAALPADQRPMLQAPAPRCAALGDDGRCGIYEVRPLVCRAHGLPVRTTRPAPGHLPVLEVCDLNFKQGLPPERDILDQETVSSALGILDAAWADATGQPRGQRVALDVVLSGAMEE